MPRIEKDCIDADDAAHHSLVEKVSFIYLYVLVGEYVEVGMLNDKQFNNLLNTMNQNLYSKF
jgi:hypothetical protein